MEKTTDETDSSPTVASSPPPATAKPAPRRPDALPSTGFDFGPLLMAGFLALCGGSGLLRVVRSQG